MTCEESPSPQQTKSSQKSQESDVLSETNNGIKTDKNQTNSADTKPSNETQTKLIEN